MANNKVVYGNQTIMDITDTTASPSDVASGEIFYDRSGVRQVGTGDYMEKVDDPTAGNVLITDANGQAQDSGYPLPTVNDATLTIQKNSTTLGTFSANSATNTTVNVTVPTAVSELTNDSGFQTAAQVDTKILEELENFEHLDYEIVQTLPATGQAGVRYLVPVSGQNYFEEWIYVNNQWHDIGPSNDINLDDYYDKLETDDLLDLKANLTDLPTNTSDLTNDGDGVSNYVTFADQATDTTAGVVKLNPAQSIDVDANGQLTVGGRLGQFPNGGVYYPADRTFANVGNYTFAITDAQNMYMSNREFIIAGGANVTLRSSHAAGSTTYRVSNSYQNRIALSNLVSGRATRQESTAGTFTVPIVSIKFANGNDISPYSGGTESNNDIIITTDGSANPSDATTQIRLYGRYTSTDIISAGQGNSSTGGKCLQVGQSCMNVGSSQVIQVGNSVYSSANNSAQFGRQHINKQTDSLLAGYGHDNSNGSQGASALGLWSSIDSNTAFAVGNGTAATARSNAFEVTKDGGIVLKSPNGTRYKITVSNTGAISATAV